MSAGKRKVLGSNIGSLRLVFGLKSLKKNMKRLPFSCASCFVMLTS